MVEATLRVLIRYGIYHSWLKMKIPVNICWLNTRRANEKSNIHRDYCCIAAIENSK